MRAVIKVRSRLADGEEHVIKVRSRLADGEEDWLVPVGAVLPYSGHMPGVVPPGFVVADGSWANRDEYPELETVLLRAGVMPPRWRSLRDRVAWEWNWRARRRYRLPDFTDRTHPLVRR